MKNCDNYSCLASDFSDCTNGNMQCAGKECVQEKCPAFNDCETCENQNTCVRYNS